MKKLILTLTAAALLTAISSCKKEEVEGVYNPKEKIQSVYNQQQLFIGDELNSEIPKFKSEEWTWEENRLSRISYYEPLIYEDEDSTHIEYSHIYTELFSYDDDDRLTSCEVLGYINMKSTYTYNSNLLESIAISEEGIESMTIRLIRDGKRITALEMHIKDAFFKKTMADTKAAKQLAHTNPLRFVMAPEQASHIISATNDIAKVMIKNDATKDGSIVITYELEWNGDNISKITVNHMGLYGEISFTYDDKNSPFYQLFDLENILYSEYSMFIPLCKNNVTHIAMTTIEDAIPVSESITYSYTYNNKDYPITRTSTAEEDGMRFIETEFYEY